MKLIRTCLFAVMFTSCLLTAEPIFSVVPGGSVTATVANFPGGVSSLDVRGASFLAVLNPGLIGPVLLADQTGGTDAGFAVLPFGNNTLFALNSPPTESAGVVFNLGAPVLAGTQLTIPAVATPLSPITNPALAAFLSFNSYQFGFELTGTTVVGSATVTTFALSQAVGVPAAIPEPGSFSMLVISGAVAVVVARRRRALR